MSREHSLFSNWASLAWKLEDPVDTLWKVHKPLKIGQNCSHFQYAIPWESIISLIRIFNSQTGLLCGLRLERHSVTYQHWYGLFQGIWLTLTFVCECLKWWIVLWVLKSFKISQIFISLQLEWFCSGFPLASFCFIILKILVYLCYYFPWAQRCQSRQNSFLTWLSVTRDLHVLELAGTNNFHHTNCHK